MLRLEMTDAFPTSVSEYLLAIPSSDPIQVCRDASAEPSAKRRKVETRPDPSPISVAKSELSFSRRCQDIASIHVSRTIHDAGSHIKFGLRDGLLSITSRSRSRSRSGFLSTLISLKPQDATDTARDILQFNGYNSKRTSPGFIGSVVDMQIERQDKTILVKLFLELLWNQTPSPYLPLGNSSDRKITQKAINAFFPLPEAAGDDSAWSPMDFYDAAHVPPKDDHAPRGIDVPGLQATLFPYQKRTLCWLLAREGMQWSGGILAEEMGLGKTLEVLGLILLNPRPTTLIVTPESLRQQWMSEIARHAPTLRVIHYPGCKKTQDDDVGEAARQLAEYDIVITTYARARRYQRAYPRTMSPLVKISWWRLCLDEAQMIENGYSQAAAVARAIPRVNAWGITGTPVKDDVKDLFGLLQFLRYEPYCYAPPIWQALIKRHKTIFQQIFRSVALRHTKALVRDEIRLPPQNRYVISMPFTAVEEQHYQSLFKEMAQECGLDLDGVPLVEDWDPEDYEDVMRTWLNRLRQTALHPEVGVYNRRILGSGKDRPMRTVEEVLGAMLEQSENAIRNDERAYLSSRLTRGQLYENSPQVKEALAIWEDVRDETEKLVADARMKLADAIREQGGDSAVESAEHDGSVDSSESENENDGDSNGRIGECRRRLRSALELHHKAIFFCANAYFQIRENPVMTDPESEEYGRLKKLEDSGYEKAKIIRREILRESNRKASHLMGKIEQGARRQSFTEIPELIVKPEKGMESCRIVDRLEVLYGELNIQANVLDEWREEVVQLLLRPLVDEEEDVETTGEEFADSARFQELLLVYHQALRTAIADRLDAISGQTNELVRHEAEWSIKLAEQGEGPAPEKMLEMLQKRAEVQPKLAQISMRGAISDFRGLQSRASGSAAQGSREAIESRIAADQLKATQRQLNEQNKAALALESEIEKFKAAMNTRLEYYRQLQGVSDAVLPYEGSKSQEAAASMKQVEEDLRRKLSSAQAKHRYLQNLKEAGSRSNEPRMCVICQMPFETGVLTVCGHQFCKECMVMWFKAHHNCPVCKRGLKPSNLHDITIKPQQLELRSEDSGQPAAGDEGKGPGQKREGAATRNTAIYSEFNAEKLAEIKNVELDGPSFTTKVDTLVRHLMWLRESDPGAKSIVFSQYKEFLGILRNAFQRFHIGHASIDDAQGIARFKDDAAVEVFLLHARAHSSGLNLVNASHVFLCEPLVNTALELQAIARVDRIGQRHETTVWLYLVSGTVEESIYNLSARRRMEHLRRGVAAADKTRADADGGGSLEAANTLELEHAALTRLMSKDRSAGEMVDRGDLWECLFGHVGRRAGPAAEALRRAGRRGSLQEKAVMSYLAGEAAEKRAREGG
ncbi:ring finger domain-containing protein [Hirsutella rhossiliensis]|uniref:Ring finger domain-containing protein n=1 Tax=Hirsutella rhossiliensis TaxID=111463 RepID=A0A9P8N2U3_9HYPO|nr:ring finger domain-containing protein [Hirsutella rhossiliensis]KAH0964931.1 ring finger domain-containing protein [Hirsutella rhossiliensis]